MTVKIPPFTPKYINEIAATQMIASMRTRLVAVAAIRNPKAKMRQVRSQYGQDQVVLKEKNELNVIQTRKTRKSIVIALRGIFFGSSDKTQDSTAEPATIKFNGKDRANPNASW